MSVPNTFSAIAQSLSREGTNSLSDSLVVKLVVKQEHPLRCDYSFRFAESSVSSGLVKKLGFVGGVETLIREIHEE